MPALSPAREAWTTRGASTEAQDLEKRQVLVVDDDAQVLDVCRETLELLNGFKVIMASSGPEAAKYLEMQSFDLLVSDIRMNELDGLAVLRLARKLNPDISAVMMTAFPTVENAVLAMKLGASDYLIKSFRPEELLAKVRHALEKKTLRTGNRFLARQVEGRSRFDDLVGRSLVMLELFDMITRVAKKDIDVLITGESGTGKELVARSIHLRSQRRAEKFVPINCGAIPENLLENEFFGHEKGSYTGAETLELGLLQYAAGGTLFLDEICELPGTLQARLLRFLQERCFRRVGGKKEIRVDLRVIAATNKDILEEVREHRFREDLYYRINVAPIEAPTLRDRKEDLPLLVGHFMERYGKNASGAVIEVEDEAMDVLLAHDWPGNVRELENVVKQTLLMASGPIVRRNDLPKSLRIPRPRRSDDVFGENFYESRNFHMKRFDKKYLTQLLARWPTNLRGAAQEAGISLATLYRLLKKYNLSS